MPRRRRAPRVPLQIELLESRELPAASLYQPLVEAQGGFNPLAGSASPVGFTPAQIRKAYGIDQIVLPNGLPADGAGMTIAIVDAFDNPNILHDLQQFDLQFGLPDPPSFKKVSQTGSTTALPGTDPAPNSLWAVEIALDVQWAHAIAPKANILLVEATNSSGSNLYAAVRFAAKQANVVVVSMSFAGAEFQGETSTDSSFLTPSGHGPVTFVAGSGDNGAPALYPAVSPNVLAVGGTSLTLDVSDNYLSELAWTGSGGGISTVEAQPSYQVGIVTQSTTKRTVPDVSFDSDPNTGFPIYDSYTNGAATPWSKVGGTSAAAPQWSALIALVNQGRIQAGVPALGGSQLLSQIYTMPGPNFHDIITGASTGTPNFAASVGYDLATGRGTPVANLVARDLMATTMFSLDTSGNLVIQDVQTNGKADKLTIQADVANSQYIITDPTPTSLFGGIAAIAGATLPNSRTAHIPFAAFAGKQLIVKTMGGNDSLTLDLSLGAFANAVQFNGGAGTNTLFGPNQVNVWNITAANAGNIPSLITFTNVQNLTGGPDRDVFSFKNPITMSGRLDGGAGSNWLDYSALAFKVVVNLATGGASRVSGGVRNINNILGSAVGGDQLFGNATGGVLLGHGAGNVINAGSGRSILIGGYGINTLQGSTGEDLLINGRTTHDTDLTALEGIRATWQSAQSLSQRIALLQAAGANQLKIGVTIFIAPGTSVGGGPRFGRGNFIYQSTLAGRGGSDWFITSLPITVIDRRVEDILTMA